MFYNTGIATYVWVLTNRKPAHRRGKVQLIDATAWFRPLRKNLGKKNCELSDEDIETHLRDVPGLRGDRAVADLRQRRIRLLEGDGRAAVARSRASTRARLQPKRSRRSGDGRDAMRPRPPVISRIHKPGKVAADPLHGLFQATIDGKRCVVEYEPDSDLRDTEPVPLNEHGGIEAFIRREVLPHAPDAWTTRPTPRSATRSASPAISTSRSHCAPSRRSAPTSWHWRRRRKACWTKSWEKRPDEGHRSQASGIPPEIAPIRYSDLPADVQLDRPECEQLWDDILRAGLREDVAAHFIGSIVYIEKGLYQVSSQQPLLVIDGQQRLTTLMLILEALARQLADGAEPVDGFSSKKVRNYYLLNDLEEEGERHFNAAADPDRQDKPSGVVAAETPSIRPLEFASRRTSSSSEAQISGFCTCDLAPLYRGLEKLLVRGYRLEPRPRQSPAHLRKHELDRQGAEPG